MRSPAGIGPVAVRQPRVRDRAAAEGERIREVQPDHSAALRPALEEPRSADPDPLPERHLRGQLPEEVSGRAHQQETRQGAFGTSTIAHLGQWTDEHERWQKRDLSAKRYVYIWADGIHLQARLEDEKQCILVIIGATHQKARRTRQLHRPACEEKRRILARELLLDLAGAADYRPRLSSRFADGALGFWKALGRSQPAREQRCWVHKTANVLNKLPRAASSKAKRAPGGDPGWPDQEGCREGRVPKPLHRDLRGQVRGRPSIA